MQREVKGIKKWSEKSEKRTLPKAIDEWNYVNITKPIQKIEKIDKTIRDESKFKFCPKCDKKLDKSDIFCHNCGSKIKGKNKK